MYESTQLTQGCQGASYVAERLHGYPGRELKGCPVTEPHRGEVDKT